MSLFAEPVELRTTATVETVRDILKGLPYPFNLVLGFFGNPISGRVSDQNCTIVPATRFRKGPRRVLRLDFVPDAEGTVLRGAFRLSVSSILTLLIGAAIALRFAFSFIRWEVQNFIFLSWILSIWGALTLPIFLPFGLNRSEREVLHFLDGAMMRAEVKDHRPPQGGMVIHPRRREGRAN